MALKRHSKRNTLNMTKAKANPVEDVWTLDDYLDNEFSYDIYDELTDKDGENFELFEPLEFFRVFYLSVEEIEQGKAKPLAVSKVLKNDLCLYGDQKLTDEQRYFFYEKILDYYSNLRHEDKQIDICCREIMKLQENLDVYGEDEEIETPKRKDAFEEVLEHLETLPAYKEKITYLIKEKTEYDQKSGLEWTGIGEKTFGEKCQLEIDKLEKLMRLEATPKQTTDGINKHKDLNQRTATLFVNYLLDFANEKKRENFGLKNKKSLADADKDRIIDFLTPISGKQSKKFHKVFRDEIAKIAEKQENSKEFYDDMQIIRNYFEMLGLSEITNRIDADLGEKSH